MRGMTEEKSLAALESRYDPVKIITELHTRGLTVKKSLAARIVGFCWQKSREK